MSEQRDSLRSAVLKGRERASRVIQFNDEEIEIKQPSVGELMQFQDINDRESIVQILINQAYVPGTNEKVFEEGDKATLLNMPAGKWISDLTDAMTELSELNAGEAEKKSDETA